MTDKELMQLALYALGLAKSSHNMVLSSDPPQSAWRYYDVDRKLQETITALDKRLAQPEQEPVAVWELLEDGWDTICKADWLETLPVGTKLYTTPPQRKPLTDEEKDAIVRQASENDWHDYELIMAVEAAHGIKP